MEEVPLLARLQEQYSRTATIVGISIDTDLDLIDRTVKNRKMTWPILGDERGFDAPIPTAYHVQGTPDIFVLDAEGRIFKRTSTAKDIEAALQAIAQSAPGKATAPDGRRTANSGTQNYELRTTNGGFRTQNYELRSKNLTLLSSTF